MANLPCLASAELEAVCKVLGDTANGLTGDEIAHLLSEIGIVDTAPSMNKWKRLQRSSGETKSSPSGQFRDPVHQQGHGSG